MNPSSTHPGSSDQPAQTPDLPAPIIAPEGRPIILVFVLIGAALVAGAFWGLGLWAWIVVAVVVALCVWCVWFFRDPPRRIPRREGDQQPVISPADGVICFVGLAKVPAELGLDAGEAQGRTRVSVFMNVFNVHVNRSPLESVVEKTVYTPGKFVNASLDKASEHNERMALLLRTPGGVSLVCVQIAGLIARRIVCRVGPGARLAAGQRFGIIRFGSRVDVYLPAGVHSRVKVGDPSVAGETILAWLGPAGAAHRAGG